MTHHNDNFVQLRIQFFKYLAKKLKLFLLQFQSDRAVVSFLSANLEEILCFDESNFEVRSIGGSYSSTEFNKIHELGRSGLI